MTLPIKEESIDYKLYKTLNEDVKLKSNNYGKFDIQFENGDYVNVTGNASLKNAIIIAIMTRYNELTNLYTGFGCRVHELIKDNQNTMTKYKLELYVSEVLENMRRIKEVNSINITELDSKYLVEFIVTSINDEIVKDSVKL